VRSLWCAYAMILMLIQRALPLAKIEHEHGLFSTYYVMINSPLYKIEDHINTLKKLLALGNEIGLHFWREKLEAEKIEVEIAKDCRELEEKLGIEVRSISFHRPPEFVLGSAPLLAGRVNAYCKKLMEWYISDSRGRFRAGEPVEAIKAKKGNLLQFLTHPIWWGQNHAFAIERITEWFNEKTKNFSEAEKREFAKRIYEQIAVMPQV